MVLEIFNSFTVVDHLLLRFRFTAVSPLSSPVRLTDPSLLMLLVEFSVGMAEAPAKDLADL